MKKNIKINLIDVGCADYISEPWKRYHKYINFLLGFDINGYKNMVNQLKLYNINNIIKKRLIFEKNDYYEMFICKKNQNSSLFPPNMEVISKYIIRKKELTDERYKKRINHFKVKKVKKVKCIRLDKIINKLNMDFDFIKIDTQGADLQVLKSLGKYLNESIIGIFIELFFLEMYKGISLYEEADCYLKDRGFEQVKKFNLVDKFCSDFLYIRKNSKKYDKIELIKHIYKIK